VVPSLKVVLANALSYTVVLRHHRDRRDVHGVCGIQAIIDKREGSSVGSGTSSEGGGRVNDLQCRSCPCYLFGQIYPLLCRTPQIDFHRDISRMEFI
jgi:hypothetical protein